MAKALWNETVIAQSEATIVVEGNHYFPPDSVKHDYLRESDTRTRCSWKGTASYYSIEVAGKRNKDAAWFYPDPKEDAAQIRNYVAFWRGVQIES